MRYKAFLFDLNGTMINDMEYHIKAWHRILNDLGVDISMEKMKTECYGKNEEILERICPGKIHRGSERTNEHGKGNTVPERIQASFAIDKRIGWFIGTITKKQELKWRLVPPLSCSM
jgi:beta-phosphoglucomutase-like phosphatase (HAD superfamily)